MSYILMSLTEDLCESRIEDYDIDTNGFPNERVAGNMLRLAEIDFQERRIWVEELKDQAYYYRMLNRQNFMEGYHDEDLI